MTHPGNEPINNVDIEHMIMIVHSLPEQWDGKVDKCVYVWFTLKETTCYTDEWKSYTPIIREYPTVCHANYEWARDDDGDGVREVHTNTPEGMWTLVFFYGHPQRLSE